MSAPPIRRNLHSLQQSKNTLRTVIDLHEEALAELIQRAEAGEPIIFMATPASRASRRTLWVDEKLKAGVDHLAMLHGVTRSAVVWTALHGYLERRDALRGAIAA